MVRRLDYHIHTKFCGHATGEMEEYVQVAISKHLDEMGFADHFIMVYLPPEVVQDDYCMKEEELPIYINKVKELQENHSDIMIKLGIEADFYPGKEKEIEKLLNRYRFDYIYASIHIGNNCCIDDDRYRIKPEGAEIFRLYERYFENLKQAVQSGLFDIMAHFDLPKKYGERPEEPITDLVAGVIEALVKHKVCIELSTGGLRKPVKEQYPSLEILQACHENDVQVTLGSDSHMPTEVGWEIDRALDILREVGYSQIVGFENRKKIFYEI